ncbi:adenylylsulfate kinase/bifunctional enzyme CysN/CysC [Pseudomonas cuatrocienegasensis]|uniref:Adenylyl-sulfate kinase n=1 Tax=Pseudomonas cuatrocienegasensis TaxID=543360 RepID=A0ABY1B9T2_9PSED|nr:MULTISPECIES: adenylyl-sulfate kinase [Pseudomonas]OEC35432.1 adenylyl-sulfate kinase [Pseudomonas sp. 21C1]SEQ32643.1 adenylylsulfate kinase/bifunctional enzyme CysN/CysC [Pseudomonas cuatrocienegasensis]
MQADAARVDGSQRAKLKQQEPCVIWFTGLSGAGKSTLAEALDCQLHAAGHHTYLLDGDNLRQGLNRDLDFSAADRQENIRRVGEVAALMVDAGLIVIAAFISPFRADRDAVRDLVAGRFVEVFVDTPLAVCEQRDPKGLYRRARAGLIKDFTGLDSPFEPPLAAELRFDTSELGVDEAVQQIHGYLRSRHAR